MKQQAERAVLASLILHNEHIPRIGNQIQDRAFSEPQNKIIYNEIKSMFMDGKPVDIITLSASLKKKSLLEKVGGYATLVDILDDQGFSKNVDYYVEILSRQQTTDNLIRLSDRIKSYVEEETEIDEPELLAKIQSYLLQLSTKQKSQQLAEQISGFRLLQEQHRKKPAGSLFGIPTGFEKLDNAIDGLQQGHLIVLGGYTSAGKTFASLNIVANLIKQKKRVVFYSLEMTEYDIIARLCGILTQQNKKDILKGTGKSVDDVLKLLEESNFEIVTNLHQLDEIQFSVIEKDARQKIDLVVIDFLQLVRVKGSKGLYEEMTHVIHTIQNLAKKTHTPFITLSQISNENAKLPSSEVSGFKGSGDIEAAADVAIKLRHAHESTDEYKESLATINRHKGGVEKNEVPKVNWTILKNRHGESGTILMRFNGYTGEFYQDSFENL